jgi:hypothetical protein
VYVYTVATKSPNSQPAEVGGAREKVRIGAGTSPDWHYWRQMPDEELWKAVALSCNIEPRRERLADTSYWVNRARWGDAGQDDRYTQFHDRLEIATARISELDVAALSEGGVNVARINLPRFAAWAVLMEWKIPPQLADMAHIATKASKLASKSENLATTERGTVQKIIAGFLAQGYSRDKIAKPYAIAKEIQAALQSAGLNLSDDTIVSWIKEAASLLTPAENKSGESR